MNGWTPFCITWQESQVAGVRVQGAGRAAGAACAGAEAGQGTAAGGQAQPAVAAALPLAEKQRLQRRLRGPRRAVRVERAAVFARAMHLPRRRLRAQHPCGRRRPRHSPRLRCLFELTMSLSVRLILRKFNPVLTCQDMVCPDETSGFGIRCWEVQDSRSAKIMYNS